MPYGMATRRTMESKNVIFIETPSRLLLRLSKETQMQPCGHGPDDYNKGNNYIIDNDFLRNIHDYTSMVELL